MKLGGVISLIRDKISSKSIIAKLTFVTIISFVIMLLVSNYMIGKKQMQIAQELTKHLEESVDGIGSDDKLLLVIDEAQIQTMAEYQVYAGVVIISTVLIGSAIFIIVIRRILYPLKVLTEKVNQVDMENVAHIQNDIAISHGSYEIKALSESFQKALSKIYDNYEKQRQFSVNVAHELRTPLAVLRTKIDVFKRKTDVKDENVNTFITTIEKNIARLSDLVEEILFLSSDTTPDIKKISIKTLISEVMFDLEDNAIKNDIDLSVEGEDVVIDTDDIMLERALYNLINNAIKYNLPGGGCIVEIVEKSKEVEINVKDTGIGMKDTEKIHAFDLFYRADESRNATIKGYGIGLALVKDIMQRLNGKISIEDNNPNGCIFRLILNK